MANTNQFLGSDLMVYIGTGGTATPIAYSRKCSFKLNSQLADSTTKSSEGAYTEYLPSLKSWELSTEGLAAWGSNVSQFFDAINNGTGLQVQFKPSNLTTGDIVFSGKVYVESFEIQADNGEVVTYSVSFKGSGKLSATPTA
jgi:predicted secreted protein